MQEKKCDAYKAVYLAGCAVMFGMWYYSVVFPCEKFFDCVILFVLGAVCSASSWFGVGLYVASAFTTIIEKLGG